MTEKQKLQKMKNRVEVLEGLMGVYNSYNKNYFSADYIMNMLNLNRNEIRKYKISKIFNDKAREI